MDKFKLLSVDNQEQLEWLGRHFIDEIYPVQGGMSLIEKWWETSIEDIACAYEMLRGHNGALLKKLRNWYQKKYTKFNPGWCLSDTAFIVVMNYKSGEYLNRFRFMRAAIELSKLAPVHEPICPALPFHKLQFPTTIAGIRKKNAVSFDHCVPVSSGLGPLYCPIHFCSLEANQMKGHTPWHVWNSYRDSMKDYVREVQSVTAKLKTNKIKKTASMPAKT